MEVFQEMVHKGCERSVITYSSLISACEKAGQWELALELFNEMAGEGCIPNTVTYNSLITACAQGEHCNLHGALLEQPSEFLVCLILGLTLRGFPMDAPSTALGRQNAAKCMLSRI